MAKIWLGKVRALFHFILSLRIDMKKRVYRNFDTPSQRKVSASELVETIEELATWIANFSINEQDYSVLLRYFSFGLHRLKSYRVRFEQEISSSSSTTDSC